MKRFFLLFLLTLLFTFTFYAQPPKTENEAIAELKKLFALRDFEKGDEAGKSFSQIFPENTELQAWYLFNKSRGGKEKETVEIAEKSFETNNRDVWISLALANAYIRNKQYDKALPISEKLLADAPENEEVIFLRASALMVKTEFAKALEVLDRYANFAKNKARLEALKAEILYRQGDKRKAFETFGNARRLSPYDVGAFYVAGLYLNLDNRSAEALPLLKRAAALSPGVLHIRQELWKAMLEGQPKKPENRRKAEVVAEIRNFYKSHPPTAATLEKTAEQYGRLELAENEKAVKDEILKKFPQTIEAEKIIVYRLRRFDRSDEDKKTAEQKKARYIGQLKQFVERPQHFNLKYLGEMLTNLLGQAASDTAVSDEEYLRLAEKAVRYEGLEYSDPFSTIADGLTKRGKFVEAEKYARTGIEKTEERIKANANLNTPKFFESFERSRILNALGNALLKQKRYDEAENILLKSVAIEKLYNQAYSLLAELYTATDRLDKAENALVEKLAFVPVEKPDYEDLKNLFKKRVGSPNGFESYLTKIKKLETGKRKEFVISQRDENPKDLPAFNLTTYDGKNFTAENLKGKITIINIWATWCAPCVKEMPDLQTLHSKYKNSRNVSIITINRLEDVKTIKDFMTKEKYDFEVIMSQNYLESANINVFPTTWFVNKEGKIIYTQLGYSKNLTEEFEWRIEALIDEQ